MKKMMLSVQEFVVVGFSQRSQGGDGPTPNPSVAVFIVEG
jgi:hypothetical protein